MSIVKFSPENIDYLIERLSKIESVLRALKMENKAHHTAIKDGAFRVIDTDGDERTRLGKKSAGVYGLIVYDSIGDIIIEATDDQVYIKGAGVNTITVSAAAPPDPADKDVWMDI